MSKQNTRDNGSSHASAGSGKSVEGEGSYTGTRRYNEHLKKHIETGNVENEAERAREALEGDEKEELEEAERQAKKGPPARSR